jgi:hypothetical protein
MSNIFAPQINYKTPREVRRVRWRFLNALAAGETISSITSVEASSDDPDAGTMTLSGQAIDSGSTTVSALAAGGTDRVDYVLSCLVATSAGQTVELKGIMRVRSQD